MTWTDLVSILAAAVFVFVGGWIGTLFHDLLSDEEPRPPHYYDHE